MGPLTDIMTHSMGALFWGALIGVGCVVLFFLLIKGWYKNAHYTIATYIVGILLACLLAVQCVLICGSVSIIKLARSYEPVVTGLLEQVESLPDAVVSTEEADQVIHGLIDQSPLLSHYIGGGNFAGYTVAELPAAIVEELESHMRWYILRRVLWCLGFVAAGAFIVIKTMERDYHSGRTMRTATAGTCRPGTYRRRPGRETRRIARRR